MTSNDSSPMQMVVVPAGSFEQIVNRQQLAVYEAQIVDGMLPSDGANERFIVMAAGALR